MTKEVSIYSGGNSHVLTPPSVFWFALFCSEANENYNDKEKAILGYDNKNND